MLDPSVDENWELFAFTPEYITDIRQKHNKDYFR